MTINCLSQVHQRQIIKMSQKVECREVAIVQLKPQPSVSVKMPSEREVLVEPGEMTEPPKAELFLFWSLDRA